MTIPPPRLSSLDVIDSLDAALVEDKPEISAPDAPSPVDFVLKKIGDLKIAGPVQVGELVESNPDREATKEFKPKPAEAESEDEGVARGSGVIGSKEGGQTAPPS